MKRISRLSTIAGAVAAAVWLASLAPASQSDAQAGPMIVNIISGASFGQYRSGYRNYSGYGYGPYGYGVSRGYVYPSHYESNDRATSRETVFPSKRRDDDLELDYDRSYGRSYGRGDPYTGTPGTLYYGHSGRESYNPYGYGGDRSYSGSPNFGHAYSPYGYGTYSAYGY